MMLFKVSFFVVLASMVVVSSWRINLKVSHRKFSSLKGGATTLPGQETTTRTAPARKQPVITPSKAPVYPKPSYDPSEENIQQYLFAERRNFQEEIEHYLRNDRYLLLLLKSSGMDHSYVMNCYINIFEWSEDYANGILAQIHKKGLAVAGEFPQHIADGYRERLQEKYLDAKVVQVPENAR